MLEELRRRADEHATEVLGLATSEEVTVAALTTVAAMHGIVNQANLCLDSLGRRVFAFQCQHDRPRLVHAALLDKPARRLRKDVHAGKKSKCENNLEGDWEAPLHRGVDVRKAEVLQRNTVVVFVSRVFGV